jgi:hypothetical protein
MPTVSILQTVQRYLNHLLDLAGDPVVRVPGILRSRDPVDGELLREEGKLLYSQDGEYHQLWPPVTGDEEAGEEAVSCEFMPKPRRKGKTKKVSCLVNARTLVVAGVSGKRLSITHLFVNNPDTSDAKTVSFGFADTGSDDYYEGLLDAGGGTWIENFMGASLIGGVGEQFDCEVSNDGSTAVKVTVRYIELDPSEYDWGD